MSKLIELGVVSEDTRQTSLGVIRDGRVEHTPTPGVCLFYKIFNLAGSPPDEDSCPA